MSIEWGSPTWGQEGHNVHIAENGSYWGSDDEGTDS